MMLNLPNRLEFFDKNLAEHWSNIRDNSYQISLKNINFCQDGSNSPKYGQNQQFSKLRIFPLRYPDRSGLYQKMDCTTMISTQNYPIYVQVNRIPHFGCPRFSRKLQKVTLKLLLLLITPSFLLY